MKKIALFCLSVSMMAIAFLACQKESDSATTQVVPNAETAATDRGHCTNNVTIVWGVGTEICGLPETQGCSPCRICNYTDVYNFVNDSDNAVTLPTVHGIFSVKNTNLTAKTVQLYANPSTCLPLAVTIQPGEKKLFSISYDSNSGCCKVVPYTCPDFETNG